jgi:dTMP kinase
VTHEKKLNHGLFVVIEGIDGAGKTTQANNVAEELKRRGYKVSVFREPTDGRWGQRIRKLMMERRDASPWEEVEFFLKDREEDVRKNIVPALMDGQIVVQDRYYFSSIAYQGALPGMDPGEIRRRNQEIAPPPDLLVILDITADEGIVKIEQARGDVTNLFEKRDYLEKVREIFLKIREPYVHVVEGSRPPDEITAEIIVLVEDELRKRGVSPA